MASGKTLQSTIEIDGVLSPSLQAAINGAVDRLSEMAEETLDAADAASRLVAEMSEQEDILKTMQKAYAGYVANGEESSEKAQDLADRIRAVSGELEENRETLKAAEKAARSLTDAQSDAADAYTKLEKKIKSQEDDLAALRRQYASMVLEQGESSDEARQLASRINNLSGELNQNKQKLKEAEKAADSFGESLEDAGQSAENSSDGYTVMKDVIADLATDTIKNAIDAFKELALEGDTALAMLEARTGANSDQMAGYKDVIKEVYNGNYGESLGDVSEKLSLVIQMTDDLDNASLAKVTKNAIALEDVFGFDVMESMRGVNSLMDHFGVTSDQAFNLIVQGAQKGLNKNDDLLDTINEYSVHYAQMGMSADDFFNSLANGTDSGAFSVDKLGDAMKEFGIRVKDNSDSTYEALEGLGFGAENMMYRILEGGDTAKEAFGEIVDALVNLDDPLSQNVYGVSLFGTMWEDLGAGSVAALTQTEGAISSANDAMEQIDTAAYDTLEAKLGTIARKYKGVGSVALGTLSGFALVAANWDTVVLKLGTAQKTITMLSGKIGTALAGISAPVWAVIAVVAVLALAFTSLWKNNEAFREKITGIWEGIKNMFVEFGQAITDRLNALGFDFANFGELIGAIWNSFCSILAPIFEGVFQQVSNILAGVLDVLVGLFDIFAGIFTGDWDMVWQGIKEVFGGVWDFLVATFSNYLNVFTSLADTVLGWFGTSWETVWGGIKSFFVNTWNSIASFFSGIWTSITSFCSNAWQTIKNVVQVGIMAVKGLFSAAFQIITLPFRFIWENCKEAVTAAWTAIQNTIGSKIEAARAKIAAVTGAIKNVASSAWNAIKSTASALWSSIQNTIGSKIDAAKAKVAAVTGAIKNVASSAWNVIKSTAANIWGAIQNTIGSKITAAKTTVGNVVNGIKSSISNALSGALSTVQSIFGRILSSIRDKINAAKNAVSTAISAIKSAFNFSWSLPKLKLPHFKINGSFSLNPPSVPKLSIDWYKDGGILTQPTIFGASGSSLLAGGEAGAEAVLPLAVLWDKMEAILRKVFNSETSTGAPPDDGLTATAGKLLTLDDFSLGSLANGTNVVIYYDFSGFTWSPQIQTGGNGKDEDDLMARLRAHEAEFFDWLDEFIKMREVAQYA